MNPNNPIYVPLSFVDSSCDRLFISLPCLFVINVCRDLPYTHFDVRHDGVPKDFSFDLLSSVCASGVEINGRISKYGTSVLIDRNFGLLIIVSINPIQSPTT